jgi:hypothetical protein
MTIDRISILICNYLFILDVNDIDYIGIKLSM